MPKDALEPLVLARMRRQLDEAANRGVYRTIKKRSAGSDAIDFSSNDYLSLHKHPGVLGAAQRSMSTFGLGSTGSRLVSGTTDAHHDLELQLASWAGYDSALVFSSGYMANVAALTALAGAHSVIYSDAGSHASLIDGSRLSRAEVRVFPRGDISTLVELIERDVALDSAESPTARFIVSDSVYSIDGKVAPVAELGLVAQQFGAVLILDEAHALGLMDRADGKGVAQACGLAGNPAVVVTATLSKAFGSQGGVIFSSHLIREYLINVARPFIFDTALDHAALGGGSGALEVIKAEPQRREKVWDNHALLLSQLEQHQVNHGSGLGPDYGPAIVSVPFPDPLEALFAQQKCAEYGFLVGCFRPPSVPADGSRLRIAVHYDHTPEQLSALASVLASLA